MEIARTHPLGDQFEELFSLDSKPPTSDILMERPFHSASEVRMADIRSAYLVLFPWGVAVDPKTGEEMVGGTESSNSVPVGNGNKKLEVVLGIYRVLALKALARNNLTAINQKLLTPSGDMIAAFNESSDGEVSEKILKISWSQSYADFIEGLDLKLKIKRRPESTNTPGEMAIVLDEIVKFDRKKVVCITDWAQGVRQVTMLLPLLHNNHLKNTWIDKATKNSLHLINTHPAWIFFANTDNIFSLFQYIDDIEKNSLLVDSFKRRLALVHAVAKNPNNLFKNDPDRLHKISYQYQFNIHQKENIWGNEHLHDDITKEKHTEPDWFNEIVTPGLLEKLGELDPKIKFISSPEILKRYDGDSYTRLRDLMRTGAGQMTVAYNLLGAIEIFLGIYYGKDEEYNSRIREIYLKSGQIAN